MPVRFREQFYVGLTVVLALALLLIWLWQPQHQVRLHSENLLHALENHNWRRFADMVAEDYQDTWGNDRARVLEKTRGVFGYLQNARFSVTDAAVTTNDGNGSWLARITIEGDNNELMAMIKERVNTLPTPFQLEWKKMSAKPWDWKLVRVTNESLVIPAEYE
jgi:hypothetical protein